MITAGRRNVRIYAMGQEFPESGKVFITGKELHNGNQQSVWHRDSAIHEFLYRNKCRKGQ